MFFKGTPIITKRCSCWLPFKTTKPSFKISFEAFASGRSSLAQVPLGAPREGVYTLSHQLTGNLTFGSWTICLSPNVRVSMKIGGRVPGVVSMTLSPVLVGNDQPYVRRRLQAHSFQPSFFSQKPDLFPHWVFDGFLERMRKACGFSSPPKSGRATSSISPAPKPRGRREAALPASPGEGRRTAAAPTEKHTQKKQRGGGGNDVSYSRSPLNPQFVFGSSNSKRSLGLGSYRGLP